MSDGTRRANQLRRTRKDLLQAAARLARQGRTPTLEECAEEAMVSRATAYRHFPDLSALLIEASLDISTPQAEELFADTRSGDPVVRLDRVDAAFHDMTLENEAALRVTMARSLEAANRRGGAEVPARQNRRSPLIDAALEPARAQFRPGALKTLSRALALVIGPEAIIVFKDVLQLDDAEARRVKRWAIRALVDAARKPGAN
ncbi:TetR/AcrR family transcriptional regulator [Variovorax sp. OV329]|uniref:TetR/AcrR family transcriptional regulator n=1 Tax=Variovorax sp. OV329 TaxID=1882825 RepID=UPI0008E7CA72|nr:TetR/AcrR family transcriptional regulator [Variovorax sp. OV329]SFL86156.1 transcriptional regulator, TetR family [Variovorax sp. OV329]